MLWERKSESEKRTTEKTKNEKKGRWREPSPPLLSYYSSPSIQSHIKATTTTRKNPSERQRKKDEDERDGEDRVGLEIGVLVRTYSLLSGGWRGKIGIPFLCFFWNVAILLSDSVFPLYLSLASSLPLFLPPIRRRSNSECWAPKAFPSSHGSLPRQLI